MHNKQNKNPDLPRFSEIKPADIEPTIDSLLTNNRNQIDNLLDSTDNYTWDNTVAKLEELDDRLNRTWSPVSHRAGTK